MKKLFKKPEWIRPEINELKYWIHILILAVVVTQILIWLGDFNMFKLSFIIKLGLTIALADVIAHTLLKLD